MTRLLSVLVLLLAATAAGAQTPDELASAKLRVQWPEFRKLYDDKAIVVVDVRDQDAFDAGHIPGARLVPLDEVERRAGELKKLGKPIVVYCA